MTVPSPIPRIVRAGTPAGCPGQNAKSLRGASDGVQGALVAPLLDPLPFRHPRLSARTFSLSRDARSGSRCRKGKGCAPAPRLAAARPDSAESDRWPLSINSFSVAIQSGVAVEDLNVSQEAVLFVFPFVSYDAQRTKETGLRRSDGYIAPNALFGKSVVRHRGHSFRVCISSWIHGDRNLNVLWAVDSDDGPDFHFSCDHFHFECVAILCFKQPLPFRIRVRFSMDFCLFPFFDMATKPITAPASEEVHEKRGPVKILRIDDVSASIFKRDLPSRGESRTFFSVAFSRSYKDASGEWNYSKSFDLEDLGKIVALCQQADEYIRGELNSVQATA
jgi:hypothetical protein